MNTKKIMLAANDTTFVYNLRKEIIESLIEKEYDVYIVAQETNFIEEIEYIDCNLINLQIPRHGTNPIADLNLYKQINNILKEIRPDIVFSNSIKPNIYFGMACKKHNIPFIPNITGLGGALLNPGKVQKIASNLYKLGIEDADLVFFQNESNKNFFFDKNIINKSKDYFILPGSGINLNENVYREYPLEKNNVKFIMIARIMKDKGIREFLQVAENIKSKYTNVEFNLVGDYDDLIYKELIENLVNKNIINYLGFRKDINDLISESHCLIHPSYHEGLSNVLLEAAAAGRPVIASDIPGCKETFINQVSGLSIKPKDSNDLMEKVELFINIPYEDKVQMGIENRKYIENKFDRKFVVRKYLECIEKYAK